MNIEGCTAIVTGANRGIGFGFVEELLAQGAARVYLGARQLADARFCPCPFNDSARKSLEPGPRFGRPADAWTNLIVYWSDRCRQGRWSKLSFA